VGLTLKISSNVSMARPKSTSTSSAIGVPCNRRSLRWPRNRGNGQKCVNVLHSDVSADGQFWPSIPGSFLLEHPTHST
jgi:hypothetical protein